MVRGIHQILGSSCPLFCEMCGIYNGHLGSKIIFFGLEGFVKSLNEGQQQAITGKYSCLSTEDSFGSLLENKL